MGATSRSWAPWLVALCLLTGAHALYLTSLCDSERVFGSTFNVLFFADTGAYALATQEPGFGDVEREDRLGAPLFTDQPSMNKIRRAYSKDVQVRKVRKHLLYAYTSNALYGTLRRALGAVRAEWTISLERLCIVFPSALLGSLAVLVFFAFTYRHSGDLLLSSLFAVLLGSSFGVWFYSSIPEATAAQILCTAAFVHLLLFWETDSWRRVFLLSLVSCLAIFQGISTVLLVPVAGLYFLLRGRFAQALVYGAVSTLVVLGVYAVVASSTGSPIGILDTAEFAVQSIDRYAEAGDEFFSIPLLQKPLYTLARFVLVGVAAMPLAPEDCNTLGALRSYFGTPLSGLCIAAYSLLIVLAARGLTRQVAGDRTALHRVVVLVSWLALLLLFYAYFDAYESILYTGHFLVPLWTLYFLGFKQYRSESKPVARLYLATGTLCALVLLANNMTYVHGTLADLPG